MRRDRLSPGLLAVAEYIATTAMPFSPNIVPENRLQTNTSDATVIHAIQGLGFQGLVDLNETLQAYLSVTDSPVKKGG
ncbi:hypothetical protein ACQZ46_17175 [Agrobacterium salinitolerans]